MIPSCGSSAARGVLFLDTEGGWGGSSRSLYYLIKFLDREKFRPIVVLRKHGPIKARYAALGIPCRVIADIPSFRPGDRKTLIAFAIFLWQLRNWPRARDALTKLVQDNDIDLIHANHENLSIIADLLARHCRLPWIGHNRTQVTPGRFARAMARRAAMRAAHLIFIVEPVRKHFAALAGGAFTHPATSVVHNIMPLADPEPRPLPLLLEPEGAFRVLSLSNFSPNRGVDRIIDVAVALKARGEMGVVFYLCGKAAHKSALTGRTDPYLRAMVDRVAAEGLGDIVRFAGHVDAERALAAGNAVIKLSRQDNPWGRDMIEAMAAGLPVLALGQFKDFIVDGETGFLDAGFDAETVADHLQALASNRQLYERMACAAQQKAKNLFGGPDRAREIEAIYKDVLDERAN